MNRILHGALLVLVALAAVGHIGFFGEWVVEDAAISWAFAKNLADGWGPVPWVGSEPVEGYSNPTWVFLLTLFELVGIHPYVASKTLAATLTAGTVVLVHEIVRKLAPEAKAAPLAAAVLFAANTQVGIWGAAGLENPLFNLLLALGLHLALTEEEHPWSALAFLGLALTRPEGAAYGLVAGLLITAARVQAGKDWVRWWLVWLAPLGLYHFLRYAWFGWALPSTAYAKLPHGREHLIQWNGAAWRYVRTWAWESSQGWFLLPAMLAVVGSRDKARWLGIVAVGGALMLYASGLGVRQPSVDLLRCGFPLVMGAALWFASHTTEHGHTRGLLWAMLMISGFFAVYARADWMEGGRWFAMAAVPLSALVALGVSDLARWVDERAEPVLAVALVLSFVWPQVQHSRAYAERTDLSPWMVRERAWKGQDLVERLHLDHRARLMSIDMGGLMMWSDLELNDVMGLVDIPVAQNRYTAWERDFWGEYLLREVQPEFLYHGPPMDQFKLWPEITDAYVLGRFNWRIRKDLLFSSEWRGPAGRQVEYDGSTLVGWDIPAQGVVPGGTFYLELGLDNRDDRSVRIEAFLVDGSGSVVAEYTLPFYGPPPPDWPDEAFYHGRWTLDLPPDLGPGEYRFGFTLHSVDAKNAPVADVPEGAEVGLEEPLVRYGEVVFSDGLVVLEAANVVQAAEAERKRALVAFEDGACEAGQRRWFLARQHGLSPKYAAEREAEMNRAWAGCWLGRADSEPEREIDHLLAAKERDPELPGLQARIAKRAAELRVKADESVDMKRVEIAYNSYRDSLRLDPYQPQARKQAERLRAVRLQRRVQKRKQAK